MKILITYYSRTGTTQKVAEILAEKLGADLEHIKDTVDRSGAKGYLISGKEGTLRQLTTIEPATFEVGDYDLVILGTPIWSWNLSSPIRTYIEEHKNNFKSLAFFCTMGGSGLERAIKEVEKITKKEMAARLGLTTLEVVKNQFEEKLDKFIHKIK